MLKLAINGRFLTHHASGVVKVACEFTKALDQLVADGQLTGQFRLLCPVGVSSERLGLKAISVEHIGGNLRGHAWEQCALPLHVRGDVLLCLGNTAPLMSLLFGRQVAVMVHDLSYRLYRHAYQWQYRLGHSLLAPPLLRFSNPIFTVSNSEKEVIGNFFPKVRKRIVSVQNGGWTDSDADIPAMRDRAPEEGYALYVGSLSERKNIHGIEEAAVQLARKFGLRTKLVGSAGTIFNYTRPPIPEDVKHLIDFCGHVENEQELSRLYQGARLLLFPSFYEASPLPPVEAMHFGCPVVASDIPSMTERCGDAAQYCDPASVESIVNAAAAILTDPRLADELMRRGYEREKCFSWKKQVVSVIDEIRKK
jgi:glycosyltransferase involved in cell wall biosynthesis